MSRKNPLVRQALQKPVGGSMPDRLCDRAAKNRPFMGISVKPARSCRAWVTYAGLSEVQTWGEGSVGGMYPDWSQGDKCVFCGRTHGGNKVD
jgi:hypothetical protein